MNQSKRLTIHQKYYSEFIKKIHRAFNESVKKIHKSSIEFVKMILQIL